MGSYYQGGSPSNYTIGGTRFWFNRLVDDTVTPNRYEGFVDMGNVVDSSLEQAIEELDHFSSKTGTRRRDRNLITEISEEVIFSLDELSTENLRSFFRGDAVTDETGRPSTASAWAATTAYVVGDYVEPTTPDGNVYKCTVAGTSGATEPSPWNTTEGATTTDGTVTWTAYAIPTVTDEVMILPRTDVKILGQGYSPSDIIVKDITDVTTYVLNTDYTVVDILGGYKGIKRIVGGGIADGDFVRVSYSYATHDRRMFAPATSLEVKGQALFFGVSDTGNEFVRSFRNTQLSPEGAFTLDDEDWSNYQLRLDILDDSDVTPTAPFGLFYHYGVGTDL